MDLKNGAQAVEHSAQAETLHKDGSHVTNATAKALATTERQVTEDHATSIEQNDQSSKNIQKHETRSNGAPANELLPLVVALEGCHLPIPYFDFPHEYIEYYNTSPSEILERVKRAMVIVTNICVITPEVASQCPNLRHVAIIATGHGWVEREWFARQGITVTNSPKCNIEAVSEHVIGLYFAVRKKIPQLNSIVTSTDEWAQYGSLNKYFELGPPRGCNSETVAIIGYGPLGQGIEERSKALGMGNVLVAERKGLPAEHPRPGRVSFEDALRMATVVVIACPKDASTIDLISEGDFKTMRKDAIIINVARGGVVNETALAKALRGKQIAGAATDVLDKEPPIRGECPLLPAEGEEPIPNLVISPHNAWLSVLTIENYQKKFKGIVERFATGKELDPDCIVVKGKAAQGA
ncbi:MAG: hypothetical protein M1831_004173 [Alyxoria varia]|nr:MAG: hypothetical protein M1831_004173 [Alyxoria varia]